MYIVTPVHTIILILLLLQIEARLFIDYQVLHEITIPLRDVVNYEASINNGSDVYLKLSYVEKQINQSLRDMVSS